MEAQSQKGWRPQGGSPKGGGGPNISRCFSPLPQQILSLDHGVRQHPVRLAIVIHLLVDVPRNETQWHPATSKLEEFSASRRQPCSNARQDSLTRETQNTVLSDVSACGWMLHWVLQTSFNSGAHKAIRFCPTFDDWARSHMRLAHLSVSGTPLLVSSTSLLESTNMKGVAVLECCRVAAKVVSQGFFAVYFRDCGFLARKSVANVFFISAANRGLDGCACPGAKHCHISSSWR